jgi:hypothetical protein
MDEFAASSAAAARIAPRDLAAVDTAAGEPDALILVDAADRVVGRLSKSRCHEGNGVLHRAFSLLIFNAAGELLIQQRSPGKRLWPLYWSNSCCSHPRRPPRGADCRKSWESHAHCSSCSNFNIKPNSTPRAPSTSFARFSSEPAPKRLWPIRVRFQPGAGSIRTSFSPN